MTETIYLVSVIALSASVVFGFSNHVQHIALDHMDVRDGTIVNVATTSVLLWLFSPLFLRAMADVYIVLAWIFKEPQTRSEKFIDKGLGSIKLEIEHRKRQLEEDDDADPGLSTIVDYWELWLSSQRMDAFVDVNLGSWSGLSTRKMAEEADCLDFYNYVYQPFSAAVHSTWPHVSDKNMLYCRNPAHRFHWVAVSLDLQPDPYWLLLAGKYLEKAFNRFDQETGVISDMPSAYVQLREDLKPTCED